MQSLYADENSVCVIFLRTIKKRRTQARVMTRSKFNFEWLTFLDVLAKRAAITKSALKGAVTQLLKLHSGISLGEKFACQCEHRVAHEARNCERGTLDEISGRMMCVTSEH